MYKMGVLCNKCQTGDMAMCRSAYIYYCIHTPPCYYTGTYKVVGFNMDEFYAKYTEKLNANYIIENACKKWTGSLTQNGKYGVISYKDPVDLKWKKRHSHRFAIMIRDRNLNIPLNMDCSHLCHNSRCINTDHLSIEPHAINNNRQHCVNSNICLGHFEFPNCLLELKLPEPVSI